MPYAADFLLPAEASALYSRALRRRPAEQEEEVRRLAEIVFHTIVLHGLGLRRLLGPAGPPLTIAAAL